MFGGSVGPRWLWKGRLPPPTSMALDLHCIQEVFTMPFLDCEPKSLHPSPGLVFNLQWQGECGASVPETEVQAPQ